MIVICFHQEPDKVVLLGVKGCSRRGVYVSLDNGTWLLNSASTGHQGGGHQGGGDANGKKTSSKK